jgi:hypothetical protein
VEFVEVPKNIESSKKVPKSEMVEGWGKVGLGGRLKK